MGNDADDCTDDGAEQAQQQAECRPQGISNEEAKKLREAVNEMSAMAGPILAKVKEIFPEVLLQQSVRGLAKAKAKANRFFLQGKFQEALRWISQGLLLLESDRAGGAPAGSLANLLVSKGQLHYHLQQWAEVVAACNGALALQSSNGKAMLLREIASGQLLCC